MIAVVIYLNGKREEIGENPSVSDVLEAKGIRPEVVTVELNNAIIRRQEYSHTILKDQDRLEFVYYMGGGRHQESA